MVMAWPRFVRDYAEHPEIGGWYLKDTEALSCLDNWDKCELPYFFFKIHCALSGVCSVACAW